MSTSNEANLDTIVISSDEDLVGPAGEEVVCDDTKRPVVLAILSSQKRVFTPTKKQSCPSDSDSDSEVDERYIYQSCNSFKVVFTILTIQYSCMCSH